MSTNKNRPAGHVRKHEYGTRPGPSKHEARLLAIDPGDVHVGLAEFQKIDSTWVCVWAGEMTPEVFLPWYVEAIRAGRWERIVCESWKLFPQAAAIYIGSDMPTSRLIGAIKAIAAFCSPDGAWFDEAPRVVFQDPQIKVPTRGWLKRRKMRSVAKILKVTADHASDAELHGYKYLIDQRQPVQNSTQQTRHWNDGKEWLSPSHAIW